MAEVLASFPRVNPHKTRKYPWDQWCDGQVLKVRRGVDFNITAHNFKALLYDRAARIGCKCRVAETSEDVVVFQFVKGRR